jgi:lysophospholipase L1-like esterase
MRVILAGDSITELATHPGGWGCLVRAGLLAAGHTPEVIGCGKGGDTVALLAARWPYQVTPYIVPGCWLTIGVGTNDCTSTANYIPPEDFAGQLAALVNRAEAQGARVILLTPPRLEAGAVLTLADNEELYAYVAAVRALAASRPTVYLADVNAACLAATDKLTYDGAHPNAAGHAVIARAVLGAWGIGD